MKYIFNLFFFIEIKNRVFLIIFSFFYNIIFFYCNKENVMYCLTHKLPTSSFIVGNYFILSGVAEIFTVYFNTIIFCALHLTVLQAFYNLFCFVTPSFKISETYVITKILYVLVLGCFTTFLFLNSVILPLAIKIFLVFLVNHNSFSPYPLFFEANLLNFLLLYKNFYLCFVWFILFCFLIFTSVHLSVFSKSNIKMLRKFFYCFFCISSTIISPPEVISQVLLFLILILFFEISVFNSFLLKANNFN